MIVRCPSLAELPPSPSGKVGWPWTEECTSPGDLGPSGAGVWPRITVVTPSFNQASFIEETIRSVLLQGYPDLQLIVIDGGSSDGTPEIIAKYALWLHSWVSEPDEGQADALNKGFRLADGEVAAYLNSDDIYLPYALTSVGLRMSRLDRPSLLACSVVAAYPSGLALPETPLGSSDLSSWINGVSALPQPSVFWRSDAVGRNPWFDKNLHFNMDREFFMYLLSRGNALTTEPQIVASRFRLHANSKTVSQAAQFWPELCNVSMRYIKHVPRRSVDHFVKTQAQHRIDQVLAEWRSTGKSLHACFRLIQVVLAFRSSTPIRPAFGALMRFFRIRR